jgi:hypothetical protein
MERLAMNQAIRQALWTLGRFPLVIAAALAGTAAALWLNHIPFPEADARALAGNIVMTAWLGVPLLFALTLLAEAQRWPRWGAFTAQALGATALGGFYWALLSTPYPVRISRFWLCMVAAHLGAALATALGRGASVETFWRYNQKLAARLGLSLGYSSLLYIGVSIALASIKTLLEVAIPDAWFLDSGIFVIGVFNTCFFLGGVPRVADGIVSGMRAGDAAAEGPPAFLYPRQLRILGQFILMPLVCIYLVIVYAYAARTLMIWRWPTGWVTYLLLSFCALGILCFFLIQPLAERSANRWVKAYSRHFHLALFPVLLLLFAAIGKRVHDYGITENRYFVLALGVWLSGIVLHSALDPRRDLRILPASLCLVALLASFGPWGASEVSRKSQVYRLKTLLESQGMLVGGKLAKAPGRIPRLASREIAGIAEYLEQRERLSDLKPWIPELDDSGQTHSVAWHKALEGKFALLEALELPYMPPEATGPGRAEAVAFSCRMLSTPIRKVSGFDYLYADYRVSPFQSESLREGGEGGTGEDGGYGEYGEYGEDGEYAGADPFADAYGPKGAGFRFSFDSASGCIRFQTRDTAGPSLDLAALFRKLRDRYPDAYDLNLPEDEMTLEAEDKSLRARIKLNNLHGEADPDGARLKGFSADVYVELKSKSRPRPKPPAPPVGQTQASAAAEPPLPPLPPVSSAPDTASGE